MRWPSLLLASALFLHDGVAGTVMWELPVGDHRTSLGAALDGHFLFEIGSFEVGFEPTVTNRGSWADAWTPVSREVYQINMPTGGIARLHTETAALAGRRAYVWGFNVDQPTREWILLTEETWTWPAEESSDGVNWVIDAESMAVVGESTSNGVVTSAAGLFADPVITAAEWRAANFVAPILRDNPAISGWEADPDADGLTNLIEMVLGSHPLIVNARHEGLPIGVSAPGANGVHAHVALAKRPNLLLAYRLELSNDQDLWLSNQIEIERDDLYQVSGKSMVRLAPLETQFVRVLVSIPQL